MSKVNSKKTPPPATPQTVQTARRQPNWKLIATALTGLVIAAFLALSYWPKSASVLAAASAKPEHGEALYQQYCVACHGAKGVGEASWQTRERGAPALDSTGHAWHHGDAQLVSMILDKPAPDSKMPAWNGILSKDDALDLLAYIKTLWTPYIRDNCQGARHMQCMNMR